MKSYVKYLCFITFLFSPSCKKKQTHLDPEIAGEGPQNQPESTDSGLNLVSGDIVHLVTLDGELISGMVSQVTPDGKPTELKIWQWNGSGEGVEKLFKLPPGMRIIPSRIMKSSEVLDAICKGLTCTTKVSDATREVIGTVQTVVGAAAFDAGHAVGSTARKLGTEGVKAIADGAGATGRMFPSDTKRGFFLHMLEGTAGMVEGLVGTLGSAGSGDTGISHSSMTDFVGGDGSRGGRPRGETSPAELESASPKTGFAARVRDRLGSLGSGLKGMVETLATEIRTSVESGLSDSLDRAIEEAVQNFKRERILINIAENTTQDLDRAVEGFRAQLKKAVTEKQVSTARSLEETGFDARTALGTTMGHVDENFKIGAGLGAAGAPVDEGSGRSMQEMRMKIEGKLKSLFRGQEVHEALKVLKPRI